MNEENIVVDKDLILSKCGKKHKGLNLFIRKIWAVNIHLNHRCKKCPEEEKKIRDILGEGKCFWYDNWSKGNYDIPLWMGLSEWLRIRRLKKLKRK